MNISKRIITLLLITLINKSLLSDNNVRKPSIESIYELLAAMPLDRLERIVIERERYKVFTRLFDTMKEESEILKTKSAEDPDADFFEPKFPEPLTPAEEKKDIYQRISEKYIGDIPSQIQDMIGYFRRFDDCQKKNIQIYNRMLLHGQPGTGKSYLVMVTAHALQLPYLIFSASFFGDKFIGESARRIRRAFDAAKQLNRPVLVFIDELDALATKRNDDMHIEHRAALTTLLTELQALHDNRNIFIFAATNDIKSLDPAVKDRFAGSICEIKLLNITQRTQLIKKIFIDHGYTVTDGFAKRLAKVTDGTEYDEKTKTDKAKFSNRDLEYIVVTTLLKAFLRSNLNVNEELLCNYVRETIDATGKKGSYAYWTSPHYCNGI